MRNLLLTFFFFSSIALVAQTSDYTRTRCIDYHKNNCEKSTNKYYQYNSESKSGLFHKGQKSKTLLEAYNGRDYRISICHDDVFTEPIIMRVIDKTRDEVLYDNSNDNFAKDFEFTVTNTIDLWIEIEVPGESPLNKLKNKAILRRDSNVGCIGLLIEYMVTPRKGF